MAFSGLGRPPWRGRPAGPPADEVGQALVERFRRGEQGAFAELFKTYRGLVHGVLFHLLRHDPELEDVVQSAFVEVFRSLPSFEGRAKLSSWIARVALHVGYHHLRRRRRRPPGYHPGHPSDERADERAGANPEVRLEQRAILERVHAILEGLPEKKRTVFLLVDLQGLPQDEVAEVVGASVATVRTRLFYARKEFWARAAADPVLSTLALDGRGVDGVTNPLTDGGDEADHAPLGASK